MLKLPLPVKAMMREWRSSELSFLFIALLIAVVCVSAVNNFSEMVKERLQQNATAMLGADAVFTSKTPIKAQWLQKSAALGLQQTITLSFSSMIEYQNQLQLAQIKAISTPYPLQGALKIANNLQEQSGHGLNQAPARGTAWLDPRLFSILAVDMGQTIHIGAARFKITGVIRDQPGQAGDWFAIAPRILINWADVAETKAVQRGSNLTYSWMLNGPPKKLNDMQDFLIRQSIDKQQWMDGKNRNQRVNEVIEHSLSYLSLSTVLSMILAGVAISIASIRYCERHLKQVALLRCFGTSQYQVMRLYTTHIFLSGIISCFLGALIGYSLQPLLIQWLGGLLPQAESHLSLRPFFLSVATGMLLLFIFSLGPLWQLRKISAITLFRQQHLVWGNTLVLTYGLAIALLGVMAYFYTASLKITFAVLLASLSFIGVALLGLWLLCIGLTKTKIPISLTWRFGVTNIAHHLNDSVLQVIGVGLALTAILTLMLLKDNLVSDWQHQLPEQAANYFVINIEPEQTTPLNELLTVHHIRAVHFYPVVRGRLIAVNHIAVDQRYGAKVNQINALQRELNLSWTKHLPESNRLTIGTWSVNDPDEQWVSVDHNLAKTLELKLGDILSFRIDELVHHVKVSSFREVDWNSFKPNFFMLFKPGILDNLPRTMITSFYLPPEKQQMLIQINKQFPNVTIIDVASTINKIRTIFASAGNAITFISIFALLIGLVIVSLAILSLSATKIQETRVLKILGMRRNTLLWVRSSEAFLIGFYSGLLAITTAIIINVYLASLLLHSQFSIPWYLFIIVPLLTAALTVTMSLMLQSKHYLSRTQS